MKTIQRVGEMAHKIIRIKLIIKIWKKKKSADQNNNSAASSNKLDEEKRNEVNSRIVACLGKGHSKENGQVLKI